jgi:hypothetical protein
MSKIRDGIERAATYAKFQRIVHDWIREDAPLAAKMNLSPSHVAKLVDRLAGTKTTILTSEDHDA